MIAAIVFLSSSDASMPINLRISVPVTFLKRGFELEDSLILFLTTSMSSIDMEYSFSSPTFAG